MARIHIGDCMTDFFFNFIAGLFFCFLYNGFGLFFWYLILLIKPGFKLAFKVWASHFAPFFGLGSKQIAEHCNLHIDCFKCRIWTCAKCGRNT